MLLSVTGRSYVSSDSPMDASNETPGGVSICTSKAELTEAFTLFTRDDQRIYKNEKPKSSHDQFLIDIRNSPNRFFQIPSLQLPEQWLPKDPPFHDLWA